MLRQIVLYLLVVAAPLLATNTAGDPTDISNWPPCAQRCIPTGLGSPSDCGSLSNRTCICHQGTFTASIAECEQLGCTSEELRDIRTLSQALCAPVGGFGSSVLAVASSVATKTRTTLATTPSLPPSVTALGPISSVLATATLSPDFGNPADISTYPLCAQICSNETIVVTKRTGGPSFSFNDLRSSCSASFRSLTAGCEAATCDKADYTKTQLLAKQLCGSLYASNVTLGSAVTSAVASATAAAIAATVGKDPTGLSSLPLCAQKCIKKNNYGGCGSLSNRECVCQGVGFNDAVGPCQVANCNATDLQATAFLAEVLCEPVGGILTHPINYTNATNTTTASPSPSPFTGEGSQVWNGHSGVTVVVLAVALGMMML